MHIMPLSALSDQALIAEVKRRAVRERHATAALVASLAEFDARRLYLGEGCASLFAYCTQVLELSEHAAYHRIEAARVVRRLPLVLERLASGGISLTAATLLAPLLTAENCRAVLDEASHRSKREVEEIVARLRPCPDVPASIRKVPERRREANQEGVGGVGSLALSSADDAWCGAPGPATAAVPAAAPLSRPAIIRPLAPARYHLQVTVSAETRNKLREAQELLRRTVPSGDAAVIIDRALTLLLSELRREKQKELKRAAKRHAAEPVAPKPAAPRSAGGLPLTAPVAPATRAAVPSRDETPRSAVPSRHIPAAIVRAVWHRDGAQCAFVGTEGRCRERSFLELHHRVPFADGGPSVADNLELRCRAHHQHESALHVVQTAIALGFEDGSASDTREIDRTRSGPS